MSDICKVTVVWGAIKKDHTNWNASIEHSCDESISISTRLPKKELFKSNGFLNDESILLHSITLLPYNFAVGKDTLYDIFIDDKCFAKGAFEYNRCKGVV